jgi:hypothetical protein
MKSRALTTVPRRRKPAFVQTPRDEFADPTFRFMEREESWHLPADR